MTTTVEMLNDIFIDFATKLSENQLSYDEVYSYLEDMYQLGHVRASLPDLGFIHFMKQVEKRHE